MDSEQEIYQNERSWKKANPSLGTIKKVEYLKKIEKSTVIKKQTEYLHCQKILISNKIV